MKNIKQKLIGLLKQGYCAPQISRLAKELKEPSATIHYNIKKLEKDGAIRTYKAVFNHKKIDEGFCTYILINVSQEKYGDPEDVARALSKYPIIEALDIVTGDYELVAKLRCKDIDEYYAFVKSVVKKFGFRKISSMTSLLQVKTGFVEL